MVHAGNIIPLDGHVAAGEGSVNQASMTGESLPVAKSEGAYVYGGKKADWRSVSKRQWAADAMTRS